MECRKMERALDAPAQVADTPKYARFTRRVRGIAIDFMLFLLVMVSALVAATALESNSIARTIGLAVVFACLLYEPLLVSLTGGTVGHHLSNLRVVDDRSDGNVSFLKAVARAFIKALLGWYSFVVMAASRRHQTVHDLLTRSAVQVRDRAKAKPHHYSGERVELSLPGMPSGTRRVIVIGAYLLASYVALSVAVGVLEAIGVLPTVSRSCVYNGWCSDAERFQTVAIGICLLGIMVLCIGLGWRARLWGCRPRTDVSRMQD
jgi:uncharacterized RDD family membrane protein YckC